LSMKGGYGGSCSAGVAGIVLLVVGCSKHDQALRQPAVCR
jgi:hypothetical protein